MTREVASQRECVDPLPILAEGEETDFTSPLGNGIASGSDVRSLTAEASRSWQDQWIWNSMAGRTMSAEQYLVDPVSSASSSSQPAPATTHQPKGGWLGAAQRAKAMQETRQDILNDGCCRERCD